MFTAVSNKIKTLIIELNGQLKIEHYLAILKLVSCFSTRILLNPYISTPILEPLYHLTPRLFNPIIVSPRFLASYNWR